MLNSSVILKRAGEIFSGYSVEPFIFSDQVRALCIAMCEAINAELCPVSASAFKQSVTDAVRQSNLKKIAQLNTELGAHIDAFDKPATQPFLFAERQTVLDLIKQLDAGNTNYSVNIQNAAIQLRAVSASLAYAILERHGVDVGQTKSSNEKQ